MAHSCGDDQPTKEQVSITNPCASLGSVRAIIYSTWNSQTRIGRSKHNENQYPRIDLKSETSQAIESALRKHSRGQFCCGVYARPFMIFHLPACMTLDLLATSCSSTYLHPCILHFSKPPYRIDEHWLQQRSVRICCWLHMTR